jgi:integrase/recombinase XerD
MSAYQLIRSHILESLSDLNWNELHYEFFQNYSSENTRKCYLRDIRQFYSFIDNNIDNIQSIMQVRRVHIVAYRDFLNHLEQAPKTVCRKFSSLSSYFDFLVEKGIFEINPCTSVKRPGQKPLKPVNDLTDEQVKNLLVTVDQSENIMHQLVIYLLFFTGIRKNELINLRLKDFYLKDKTYLVDIIGKGKKLITKIVEKEVYEKIESYLSFLKSKGEEVMEGDFLLRPSRNPQDPSNLNKRLNPKSIDYIFNTYCQKAGVFHRVSPHSARASYIGSALENGANLLHVSQDVGHSSVKTTQEYNKRRSSLKNSPVNILGYKKSS